jgi:O-acetyl-ADP-ribose deacetylase (regulator of RNase III)
MMKEVEGDILLTKAEALAHGIAVNDDFKNGLAAQLREQWPSLYKDFRHFCKTHSPKEGDVWSWKGPGTPVIVSLFTQAEAPMEGGHPGKATVPNVNHALKNLVKELDKNNIKSLAITKLSTGVGGLNWDEVKPVLDKDLSHYEGNVYVYSKYVAKSQAQE